ncbi:MAG: hypothetical protein R6X29_04465 [Acidimicrobiia bacterium]
MSTTSSSAETVVVGSVVVVVPVVTVVGATVDVTDGASGAVGLEPSAEQAAATSPQTTMIDPGRIGTPPPVQGAPTGRWLPGDNGRRPATR